jgi:molybdenum cofactor biosynthesis enzyme MoaA
VLDKTAESLYDKDQYYIDSRDLSGDKHTPINSLTWRFCMRCSRVRCSAAESLQLEKPWSVS